MKSQTPLAGNTYRDTPRLKHVLSGLISGGTPDTNNEEYWADGDEGVAWVAIGDMSTQALVTTTEKKITESGVLSKRLRVLRPGTLIYSMYASIGHVAELGIPATINQALLGFEFSENVVPAFAKWWLRHLQPLLLAEASSNTQDNLNADKVKNLPFPALPIHQQTCIANYLDRETARIDALIAEKERMLALLEEKRAALISRVVTRGLDPTALLKPSGQEWLGEIPAHWRVERAKNLFTIRDERSDDGSEELLTVSHITGVTSRSEKDVYMFEADDKAGYKRCMPGDLAINTLWAWMGAMGISPMAGIVSPDYHVYTSKGELLPEYVDLLCRSRPFVAEVSRWSKGVWSSRLRLYPENFFEMRLPVPPHDEQAAIVRAVEQDQRKANALRESLRLSITLAKERRAALITAAVTGQIPLEEMQP
ncbi:MAG: restriction endonuclease subunit S [Rehaibacterium terrae]|uniref:restriction endonuclease subunit S n=1 Tax=Rehaibacterium terrae TaxID=1341696 RepID=UPI00391AE04F